MNEKTSMILPIIAFFFTFFFYAFLTQNLPFTVGDDLNTLKVAIETPWHGILKEALNPISPAWHINSIDSLLTTRAMMTLIIKIIYTFLGLNWEAFHLFKDLMLACAVFFFAFFLSLITKNRWTAFFTAILIPLTPAIYDSVSWISDFEIMSEMFILISFTVFFVLYFNRESLSLRNFCFLSILLIFSTWLGIEIKETAKMIPCVLIGFMVLDNRLKLLENFKAQKRLLVLFLVSIGLFTFVIPRSRPDFNTVSYKETVIDTSLSNWKDLIQKFVHGNLIQKFSSASHHRMMVLGLAAILAFILCCFLVFFLIISKQQSKDPVNKKLIIAPQIQKMLIFGWVWFAISFFPLIQNLEIKLRYFIIPLFPMLLLVHLSFSLVNFNKSVWVKTCLATIAFIFALFWAGLGTFGCFYLRIKMNSKDIIAFGVAKSIYKDLRPLVKTPTMQHVLDLYSTNKVLSNCVYNDLKICDWDYPNLNPEDAMIKIKTIKTKLGHAYLVIKSKDPSFQNLGGDLLAEVPSTNNSLLGALQKKLHLAGSSYCVYRF